MKARGVKWAQGASTTSGGEVFHPLGLYGDEAKYTDSGEQILAIFMRRLVKSKICFFAVRGQPIISNICNLQALILHHFDMPSRLVPESLFGAIFATKVTPYGTARGNQCGNQGSRSSACTPRNL